MRPTNAFSKLGMMAMLCGAVLSGACDDAAPQESSAKVGTAAADKKDGAMGGADRSNDMPSRYAIEGAPEEEVADEVAAASEPEPKAEPAPPPAATAGKRKVNLGSSSDALAGLGAPAEMAAKGDMSSVARPAKKRGGRPGGAKDKWARAKPRSQPAPMPEKVAPKDPSAGEGYDHVPENDFIAVADDPRSTFSIDVDTAAYSNVRRFLNDGTMPPPEAVRAEELINYFSYNYESPIGSDPFSINTEVSGTPWNEDSLLVSVGLQGQRIDMSEVGPRNLVFLLDVSGSMNASDKLPLLKQGLGMLVNNLRDDDRVSIVVYAGASGVVLEPTMGNDKPRIMEALNRLSAGGSTNGGQGIKLAYEMASKHFEKDGINRVILATDGDFNVGVTNRTELTELIESKRKSGVFLSVLGFGTGNMQDSTMEMLADKGNGNYAYIDSKAEARKVLVEEAGGTLVTIAKDVKIQVEFNPAEVESYRLIGYENRKLAHADFNDDTKDAGEIGAGHSVTALYEVTPKGSKKARSTDKLKYQDDSKLSAAAASGELLTVKVRYKKPDGNKSRLITTPVTSDDRGIRNTSKDFRFAAAVAQFGMLLRHSKHKGTADYDAVLDLAKDALGSDPHGHRKAFLELVKTAKRLDTSSSDGTLARRR
ncbi:MAG: VWA domain-containing protein [Myxococcota bacterium]